MNKPKVIVLYNKFFHYRIPVWNELAKRCDLTVTYSEGDGKIPAGMECNFKILYLPAFKFFSRFVIQKTNIRKLVKAYDVIVAYSDIAWLKYSTLSWFSSNKVIYHAIGVSASYTKGFDEKKNWDRIRNFFFKRASAMAFYTDYPIEKYVKAGFDRDKLFVAPNTVAVAETMPLPKNSILMVGTLYKQKGLQLLLDAYLRLKDKCNLPLLNIIGNGPDFEVVDSWIKQNKMENLINLRGAIYELEEKAKYFSQALACISPKQAGLTVLESMGYGVPFITSKNALTGGEIFNIHNGIDGIIMDDPEMLSVYIKDIAEHPKKYIEMGNKAKYFYDNNRTIQHMADGLWSAISYSLCH